MDRVLKETGDLGRTAARRRALLSVFDKTGLVDFARTLVEEFNFELLSTGGTAKALKDAGLPVLLVEDVTGVGELLGGRVKTLHPAIHAAILADRDNPEHMRQLAEAGITPIDLVAVNLYPFEQTIAKPGCTIEEAIEMIDIGGVALLRAAAKNHKHVLVISDPEQYWQCTTALRSLDAQVLARNRQGWASDVMSRTNWYDFVIMGYLGTAGVFTESTRQGAALRDAPDEVFESDHSQILRYGENPHQTAVFSAESLDTAERVTPNSEMSYNNYLDADAATGLCGELCRAGIRDDESMCGTGFPAGVPENVTPAFQPVTEQTPPSASLLTDEEHRRRNLPHIERPAATYFITFRVKSGALSETERQIAFDACKYWSCRQMAVHACVIMPDHVHLLITPFEIERNQWVPISKLLQSIKGFSAREINKLRMNHNPVWQDESWDRIVRSDKEFLERYEYISENPSRRNLGTSYPWLWLNNHSWKDLEQFDQPWRSENMQTLSPAGHRLESRCHSFQVVFVKHTNPCGVGVAADPIEAYRRAYHGDPNAAMGGILACGFRVDCEFASAVMGTLERWGKPAGAGAFFIEVWISPEFDDDAIQAIRTHKPWGARVRLLSRPLDHPAKMYVRTVASGTLQQSPDLLGLNESDWKVVTERAPSDAEMNDLRLAWLVAKHTKSNAISICKDGMLIGNGAGQMSRVMSCRLATWLARENGHAEKLPGSVAASDAFFPFRDGPDILIDAGVSALIQPGGSKRDADTIASCNERGIAMIFTGTRHFRH